MVFRRYRKFVKRTRKGIVRANRTALKGVWTAIKALRTAQNSERKYWDRVSLIQSTVSNTVPFILATPWDGLTKALDANGRLGDTIKALYTTFKCRFDFAPVGLNDGATAMIRIIAIVDTEPRVSSTLTPTQLRDAVLQVTSTGPMQINSPYKVTLSGTANSGGYVGQRYRILKDFTFRLDNVSQKQKQLKLSLNHMKNKMRGIRVKYADADANDWPSDNRLYILAVTDHPTANDILIDGEYSRVCYVDN